MSQGPFSQKVCLLLKISHNAMQLAIFYTTAAMTMDQNLHQSIVWRCKDPGRTRRSCKLLMEWTHYTTLSSLVEDFEASTIAGFGSKYSVTILCWSRNLDNINLEIILLWATGIQLVCCCFVLLVFTD